MKTLLLLLLSFLLVSESNGQILKRLKRQVKENAEWKVERKINQKVDQAIDSVFTTPKKITKKKKDAKNDEKPAMKVEEKKEVTTNEASVNANGTSSENDMTPKDGYVTLNISAKEVFSGATLSITGKSVKYKQFTKAQITISGPSVNSTKEIDLDKDGKFSAVWYAPNSPGNFTITVRSSDGKATRSVVIKVYALTGMGNWADRNIGVTKQAFDKLKKEVDRAKTGLGSKDAAALQAKLDAAKKKEEAALKLFSDLNTAGKKTAALVTSGKALPKNLAANLSVLNNLLNDQVNQMQQIEDYANHEAYDNTICEYLVMVNEACAAFSTITNFWSKSIFGIIQNITVDKVIPQDVEIINNGVGVVPQDYDVSLKEPAKIFATAYVDANSLATVMGDVGLAGDILQFATEFLLKKYCGVFEGKLTHDYTIAFRNEEGITWWKYGVKMKAAISFRYPKKQNTGIIKMKGNIEGNATNFSFYADIAKEDEFRKASKDKLEVIPLKVYTPLSIGYSATEVDILGFGAIARGVATPAYFNIPVDADYDVNANTVKIFINNALIDFSSVICNQYIFLLVGGDLFPYIKAINFPIHKARLTLKAAFAGNNIFKVEKDAKGNLNFSGTRNAHIGGVLAPRETDLNFTITAKKQ